MDKNELDQIEIEISSSFSNENQKVRYILFKVY